MGAGVLVNEVRVKKGQACPDCGHASALHPGIHNPALGACLICEIVNVLERLRAANGRSILRFRNDP